MLCNQMNGNMRHSTTSFGIKFLWFKPKIYQHIWGYKKVWRVSPFLKIWFLFSGSLKPHNHCTNEPIALMWCLFSRFLHPIRWPLFRVMCFQRWTSTQDKNRIPCCCHYHHHLCLQSSTLCSSLYCTSLSACWLVWNVPTPMITQHVFKCF